MTATAMFSTDEILWYDNGRWGEAGYAIANPAGKVWTNNSKWGWGEKLSAGIKAAWSGLPLSLEGLYDEAVNRAEAKQAASAAA
ncbi:MAG: hypothetical protein AB7O59_18385 [Pirellulales bacterium]